jgi:hypothetical protein
MVFYVPTQANIGLEWATRILIIECGTLSNADQTSGYALFHGL